MAYIKSVLLDREQLFLLEQLLLISFKDIDLSLMYCSSDKYILESNEEKFNQFKKLLEMRFSLYKYIHSLLVSLDNENRSNEDK